jgi:hypothetical protein
MSRPNQPPLISARMSLQVRTVEGHFTVLSLPATDHRIVSGDGSNYLVGFGTVHEFSKDGLYLRSGPAPAVLGGVAAGGEHPW